MSRARAGTLIKAIRAVPLLLLTAVPDEFLLRFARPAPRRAPNRFKLSWQHKNFDTGLEIRIRLRVLLRLTSPRARRDCFSIELFGEIASSNFELGEGTARYDFVRIG